MADILKWSGYTFCVKPTLIQGIRDITIKSSSETNDSQDGLEKYVSRKNSSPHEINFTALLNRYLGVDVKTTAIGLLEAARKSEKGYIYMAGAKLLPCQFMAISADVGELEIAPNGTWISCEVRMSMKQCSKYDVPPAPPTTTTWETPVTYPVTTSTPTTTTKSTTTTTKNTTTTAMQKLREAQDASTTKEKAEMAAAVAAKAKATSNAVLNDANKKVPTSVDVVTMAAPKASTVAAKANTAVQNLTATAKAKVLSVTTKIVSLKQ